jgi:segregation and condensation protein B
MTRDEAIGSLADQAAAWVPPWARSAEPDGAATANGSAEPAVSAEPVEAAAAAEPVEPAVSAEPAQAAVSAEPAQAAVSAEPAGQGLPAEPVEPPMPPEPAEPAIPPEPAVPVEPGVPPEPPAPAVPEEPAEPIIPAQPLPPSVPPPPAEPVVPEPAEPVLFAERDRSTGGAQPSDEELRGALEAILLVVDEPVGDVALAQVVEQPTDRVTAVLDALAAEYAEDGRGFELRRAAGGWRLYTSERYAPYVERFVLDGQQVRLTQAALETLAVVAYKQPVTRSRISAIRGVNCDGVVRTLVSRGLIEECGTEPDSGAFLYRTTSLFLERLGLDSLEQLPALAPLLPDDVDAIADAHG